MSGTGYDPSRGLPGPPGPAGSFESFESVAAMRADVPSDPDAVVALNTYDPDNNTWADQGIFQADLADGTDDGVFRFNAGGLGSVGPGWERITPKGVAYTAWGGAVGDGVVNDTAAINRVSSALNARGGGIIYYDSGTYLVNLGTAGDPNAGIKSYSGITHQGAGIGRTIIKSNGVGVGATCVYSATNLSNVHWRDLTIQGNRAAGNNVTGFWLTTCQHCSIERVHIASCRQNGVVFTDASYYCSLRDSKVTDWSDPLSPTIGFGATVFRDSHFNDIVDNEFEAAPLYGGYGIIIDGGETLLDTIPCTFNTIARNKIKYGVYGIAVEDSHDNLVADNDIALSRSIGIWLTAGQGEVICLRNKILRNKIHNTTVAGAGPGLNVSSASYSLIQGNSFDNLAAGWRGISIARQVVALNSSYNDVIENKFTSLLSSAIYNDCGVQNSFVRNIIHNITGHGFEISASLSAVGDDPNIDRLKFEGNVIENLTGINNYGIYLLSITGNIENVRIRETDIKNLGIGTSSLAGVTIVTTSPTTVVGPVWIDDLSVTDTQGVPTTQFALATYLGDPASVPFTVYQDTVRAVGLAAGTYSDGGIAAARAIRVARGAEFVNTNNTVINGTVDAATNKGLIQVRSSTGAVYYQLVLSSVNGDVAIGLEGITTAVLSFPQSILIPTIQQETATSDHATRPLTFKPQRPFATATGANRNPGYAVVDIGLPISGGAEGYLQVQRNAVAFVSIGAFSAAYAGMWVGPTLVPSNLNYFAISDGDTDTRLNVPNAAGILSIAFAGVPKGSLQIEGTALKFSGYATGSFIQTTVLTSGTTFTTSANTRKVKVRMVGGGGGGGGAGTGAASAAGGGGGAAGSYAEKTFVTTPSTNYTYAIGAAGAGGTAGANNGAAGGNTSITIGTLVTANGGAGGNGQAAGTVNAIASGAVRTGVSTGGDVNAGGEGGNYGLTLSGLLAVSGKGGNSQFGAGGSSRDSAAAGVAGTGFGAGGSGGQTNNGSGAVAGGAGVAGVIVIEEYA